MNNYKIGFIGAGNMAKAIIQSMISHNYNAEKIKVFDVDKSKYKLIHENLAGTDNITDVVKGSDIIFLAVKPQNYSEVLSQLSDTVTSNNTFVSIAAGISTDYIKNQLNNKCEAIRVMPNTPLLLGKGATAIAENKSVSADIFDAVVNIFKMSSHVEIIPENKMNEVISINGSSPAYIYLFVKAMMDYAKSVDIDQKAALSLACQTLIGSAEMLINSGFTPDELIKMVSSPGGTTIAALNKLEQYNFYDGIKKAMEACTNRAEELSL